MQPPHCTLVPAKYFTQTDSFLRLLYFLSAFQTSRPQKSFVFKWLATKPECVFWSNVLFICLTTFLLLPAFFFLRWKNCIWLFLLVLSLWSQTSSQKHVCSHWAALCPENCHSTVQYGSALSSSNTGLNFLGNTAMCQNLISQMSQCMSFFPTRICLIQFLTLSRLMFMLCLCHLKEDPVLSFFTQHLLLPTHWNRSLKVQITALSWQEA